MLEYWHARRRWAIFYRNRTVDYDLATRFDRIAQDAKRTHSRLRKEARACEPDT